MKAIHNILATVLIKPLTVFNTSKIQNESNSQQGKKRRKKTENCV